MAKAPPVITVNVNVDIHGLLGMMKQNLVNALGHISQPVEKINPDEVVKMLQIASQHNDVLRHMLLLHAQAEAQQLEPNQRN